VKLLCCGGAVNSIDIQHLAGNSVKVLSVRDDYLGDHVNAAANSLYFQDLSNRRKIGCDSGQFALRDGGEQERS
jgi:hypothetical protein